MGGDGSSSGDGEDSIDIFGPDAGGEGGGSDGPVVVDIPDPIVPCGGSECTTADSFVPITGVDGVTDTEIAYSIIGVQSVNPLGTCMMECFNQGVQAYFNYVNDAGGVHGRKLVVKKTIDDELAKQQEKALEVINAKDSFGVFAIGQLLEGYVLVPKLVGDKIGLHPVAVIFAVLAGGSLFGFLGVLLALPAASVIMVLLRYLLERYRMSELYNEEGPDDPVIAEVDVTVHRDGKIETDTTIAAPPQDDRTKP